MAISILSLGAAQAEFSLNFQPNPNVVSSIANWSCNAGDGGGMGGGGGMGMFGPGCGSDYFLQELVNDNGTDYYHVILGDPTQDDFAVEFYMRSGGCCWWPNGGGGMGMGGDAPFSSSHGDINDPLASAWLPLEGPGLTGNGTGNPTRIYLRQINNDPDMTQEFIKSIESNKPKIVQIITDNELRSHFELDMQNGDHNNYTTPIRFINQTTIAGIGSFDAIEDTQKANPNAGRYTYTPGNSYGESYGVYTYDTSEFNVFDVDWISYCNEDQNPDQLCNFIRGGGGMMGGGMGM